MSEYDSDESLNTEDLNEINNDNDIFEEQEETVEIPVKSIEREPQTKIVKKSELKKSKPTPTAKPKKERTEAQKAATLRMIEANKKRKEEKLQNKIDDVKEDKKVDVVKEDVKEELKEEVKQKVKVKKPPSEKQLAHRANLVKINKARAEARRQGLESGGKLGRKKQEINVIKEKIIYMMPDNDGNFKQVRAPRLTDKYMKKQEDLKKNNSEFDEIQAKASKILKQTKSGKVDKRSQKTEAQLKILEKAREKARLKRLEKLKQKKEQEHEELKQTITDSVIDVVTKPATEIKEIKKKKRLTDDQLRQYQLKKDIAMF